MKVLCILLAFLLLSCSSSNFKDKIVGKWTTIETIDASKDALTDIVTFNKDGSIYVEYLLNGNVIEKIPGKYWIKGKVLTTKYDSTEFHFDIHELSRHFFVARQEGAKALVRLRRLEK